MARAPAATLAALILLGGCASGLNRPVVSVEANTDANGVQHVEVNMHSFYFEPNRIVVHAGKPVDLEFKNRSIFVPHNFTIHEEGLTVDVDKWGLGSAHARFTAPEPGEYRFFCHVGEHGKKGMVGTLVVVP
ncbi:MAG TPA: cupredoxin domain-containing protein [Candidatus Eisenbacteria bacterium]|nr:cupredoxin domain-containing protein [Candidatus Eisenbacteria bacterium]